MMQADCTPASVWRGWDIGGGLQGIAGAWQPGSWVGTLNPEPQRQVYTEGIYIPAGVSAIFRWAGVTLSPKYARMRDSISWFLLHSPVSCRLCVW